MPLACSKHGSRALDALWASGSPAHRAFIAETLAPHQQQLRDNFFGKFAVRNFALPLFIKKRADWTAYVKREANKRKMFADLLPTTPGRWQCGRRVKPPSSRARSLFLPAIEHAELVVCFASARRWRLRRVRRSRRACGSYGSAAAYGTLRNRFYWGLPGMAVERAQTLPRDGMNPGQLSLDFDAELASAVTLRQGSARCQSRGWEQRAGNYECLQTTV